MITLSDSHSYPILQMRKLSLGEVNNMPKAIKLGNDKTGI